MDVVDLALHHAHHAGAASAAPAAGAYDAQAIAACTVEDGFLALHLDLAIEFGKVQAVPGSGSGHGGSGSGRGGGTFHDPAFVPGRALVATGPLDRGKIDADAHHHRA